MKTINFLSAIAVLSIVFTSCKKENVADQVATPVINTNAIGVQTNYQSSVRLGSSQSFVILAANSIINNGYTVVGGDLGIYPGSEIANFPKDAITGAQEITSDVAEAAQKDAAMAYEMTAARESAEKVTLPADSKGLTLTQGLYNAASLSITEGSLYLDAKGDENAVFIIQVTGDLTLADDVKITLLNKANPALIFWQVAGNVTLGDNSIFKGTILANQSIAVGTGAAVQGRLISTNGAVTLDTNVIIKP